MHFHLDDFIGKGECFHFGRSRLERTRRPLSVHDHNYVECFWITSGAALHWVNGHRLRLTEGSMVFMRPADSHALTGTSAEHCITPNIAFPSATAMHLKERYPETCADRYFWSIDAMPAVVSLDSRALQQLGELEIEIERGDRSRLSVERFLLQLICQILREPDHVRPGTPAWLTQACRATADPQIFRAGAAGFVKAAGRAHEHVCRSAQQHLGLSPSAYVNQQRMNWAARQLAGTDRQIIEIAGDCGLDNLSHFYRLFRTHHHTTPRRYRLLHQANIV